MKTWQSRLPVCRVHRGPPSVHPDQAFPVISEQISQMKQTHANATKMLKMHWIQRVKGDITASPASPASPLGPVLLLFFPPTPY